MKKDERQVLYRKYRALGFEHEEAIKKIDYFENKLQEIKLKMKSEKKSKVDINKRFKAEFEKLCQKMEAER